MPGSPLGANGKDDAETSRGLPHKILNAIKVLTRPRTLHRVRTEKFSDRWRSPDGLPELHE
jgi:hypothetical protein